MNLFYFLIRASRNILILAILAGIVSGVSSAGLIAIISTTLTQPTLSLGWLAAGFAGLGLVVLSFSVLSQTLLNRLSQGAILELRMRLSRSILASPLRRLEEQGMPRLMAALTDDVLVITNALFTIPPICINLATLVICLFYLAWLSVQMFAAVLGFMAVGMVIHRLLIGKATRSLKIAREEQDALFKHFRALTEGAKQLKLNSQQREAFLTESLQSTAVALRQHNVTGMTYYAVAGSWGQFLFYFFIALLLFAVPALVQTDTRTLTTYVFTLLYIWGPLGGIMFMLPALGRARISLKKVESLGLTLAAEGIESSTHETPEPSRAWQHLELDNVTHAYHREGEERSFVLGPINLVFKPGELVFLIGGNGSGKTTLAKLLTGLYPPEHGEIRLNGLSLTKDTREHFRQLFSVLFSDFYLFENLYGVGTPQLEARAHHYLRRLQLDGTVKIKDGRLSTTSVSQGQRKRLALLAAYLDDRPFYVFDEWAADQDPLFKEVFYMQLLPELKDKGKTVLVITHDERYFHVADRTIKLDYGRIESDEAVPLNLDEFAVVLV